MNYSAMIAAEQEGRKAFKAGHPACCPFNPDCDARYYAAWHAGWIAEHDAAHIVDQKID